MFSLILETFAVSNGRLEAFTSNILDELKHLFWVAYSLRLGSIRPLTAVCIHLIYSMFTPEADHTSRFCQRILGHLLSRFNMNVQKLR